MRRLLTICLLVATLHAAAQYASRRPTADNDMDLFHVRCIAQDQAGFIWMGSGSGLYRYDGYHYQRIQEQNTPQLFPDESIQSIDSWGKRYLWLRLRGNLYACYDTDRDDFVDWSGNDTNLRTYRSYVITDSTTLWLYDKEQGCRQVQVSADGTFTSHDYDETSKTLPSNHISFILQERPSLTWVGTEKGLVCIRQGKSSTVLSDKDFVCAQQTGGRVYFLTRQGHIFTTASQGVKVEYTPATPLGHVVRNVAAEQDMLIITTDGPTLGYHLRNRQLAVHPDIRINHAQLVTDNRQNKVVFDHDGTDVWYITPQRTFHLINIYSHELTRQHAGGRFRFVQGSHGYIWISTYGNGLFAYDTTSGTMRHILSEDRGSTMLASDYLLNIFEDRQGVLWVCQESHGPRMVYVNPQPSRQFFFTNAADQSHANNIRLMQPVGDKIYLGNRMNSLWLADKDLEHMQKDNPYDDDVVAVELDRRGRLWIGTRKKGVFVDGQQLGPIMPGKVSDILCDRQGRVWISMFDEGLELVITDDKGGLTVRSFFKDRHAITQPRSMIEDYQGRIWLCSSKGVYMFHPDRLIRVDSAYYHFNVCGTDMNANEVHCIYEDSRHHIWAGTSGYGLACLDSKGQLIKRLTTKDGLPNDRIESIIEDDDGNIWAGTGYGLAKYDVKTQRISTFYLSSTELGLMHTENCAMRTADGQLAFGTLHGMQVFNPKALTPVVATFPLSITNIFVNGVSLHDMDDEAPVRTALYRLGLLRLSHDQNSLTFHCSDFEYVGADVVRFSYWLEGYDEAWSELTSLNFTTYKNLPPGHYTLHVRSYNVNGQQSDREAVLGVIIRQPWWNTWWAWLIYLIAIGATAWAVWRQVRHVNELHNRIKVENQLTEYKLRFFTNISHEFRTPLTIIRGAMDHINAQGDIPGVLKQPLSTMQKGTDRMLRLVNELLGFRKIQNEKLRLSLEETEVVSFLRNIFLSFNETAQNRQISYQFSTFAREYKMYLDRNYVDKMAYNLLSNAFKYTMRKHSVTMRVFLDGDRLGFEVEDTGIGVPKEKQGDLFSRYNQSAFSRESIGIGLNMVSELVRVHHGDITFRENPAGQGSIFTITLPTDKSVYQPADFLAAGHQLLSDDSESVADGYTVSYKAVEQPPLNDRRVLVVDDDDDMRDYISSELRHYFVVDTACDGEEAMQNIQEERPDLIVSDVRMPGMNGFDLTKKIRQTAEISDLPIILLTAITDEEKMVKGTEYGADDYLFKPFNMKVLTAKCVTLITQRDRMRVKYAKEVVGSAPLADIIVDDADKKFQERFDMWIYSNLHRKDMQAIDFANSMKMGRTTFFKKAKQVTGMPPHEYIRKLRLQKAAELLQDPTLTIAEVAYQTGFDDPNYFSRNFKEYYGMTASQFRKGKTPPNPEPPSS